MRIAFRADASAQIGLGHVKRCLALAAALREMGATPCFVTRDESGIGARLVEQASFEVRRPNMRLEGQSGDAAATAAALEGFGPDWIVVDHYGLDARWHDAARLATGACLAAIDDIAGRPLHVDLLIDHNPASDHRAKYAERLAPATRLLGGPRYALIDPSYAKAPRHEFHNTVRSIGVFMGGADAVGASGLALAACREHARFAGPMEVVTTASNSRAARLGAECARWPATRLSMDLPDLKAFFSRHDLQIGAGGGASWERCCLGAPSVAVVCADNQRQVVEALANLGVVEPVGGPDAAAIGRAVMALLSNPERRDGLRQRGMQLVDGLGSERAAVALWRDRVSLRAATDSDADVAYAWRNHPRTREHFHDPSAIGLSAHRTWWSRTLAQPSRQLLLIQCGLRDVGVLRFDHHQSAEAVVSIYIDPQLVGLGLGTSALRAGLRRLRESNAGVQRVLATIRPQNGASQTAFAAAGFRQRGPMEWECRIVK